MTPPMIGVDLIHAERTRQLEVEGFTPAHDGHHHCGELSSAATCYLSVAASCSLLAATGWPANRPIASTLPPPPTWPGASSSAPTARST